MAEVVDQGADDSIEAAAASFAAMLNPQPDPAQGAVGAAQPDPASETDQPEGQTEETQTGNETAQADAAEHTASQPVPKVAPAAPQTSPEVTDALAKATKAQQEAEATRNQHLQALNTYIPQLDAAVKGQFADIKTQDDLLALGDPANPKYNPDRYNAAIVAFTRLNNAVNHQRALQAQQQDEQNKALGATFEAEKAKLATMLPELSDPDKGPALERKLLEYAKSKGISTAGKTAAEIVTLYESMQLRDIKAQQAEAAKKAAGAPPVQKPGTPRQTTGKQEKLEDDWKRFQNSGRVDDAAAVFRSILN